MRKFFAFILTLAVAVYFIPTVTAQQAGKISTSGAPAEGNASVAKINWVDIEVAAELNAKKPKKIFLDMYTDWCGWCKKMDQTTFINPVIVDYMNRNYYAVKFNAERKDEVEFKGNKYVNANPTGSRSSHDLAKLLMNNRMSYPSFVFLDENLNVITIVPGYRKAPEFDGILHYIGEDAYKSKKWDEFSASFKTTATE